MDMQEYLDLIEYKIGEGSEFQWNCFGPNARFLEAHVPDFSQGITAIFDSVTQEIYMLEVYNDEKNYMWFPKPENRKAYEVESKEKISTDEMNSTEVFLEVEEDFIEKATAVMKGEKFDPRVQIPLTLDKEELFALMQLAHERDITLNVLIEQTLREFIEKM